MKRIRVLHIITHLNVGGAQDNTLITVEKLDKQRYDVTLLYGPGEEWLTRARDSGVNLLYIKELIRKINGIVDLVALVKVYRIIKKGNYDVVHTHSSKPGFTGRIAAKLAGVPVIVHTIHGFPFHDYMHPLIKRGFILLERILSRCADRLVTVSRLNKKKAVQLGLDNAKKFVNIYSGIYFGRFDRKFDTVRIKERLGIGRGEAVVGMVGRLSEQKSPLTFIESIPLIVAVHPAARFVLVGDGELRPDVEACIRRLKIEDKVMLLGSREDVPELMAVFNVFVLSSLWEGLGRSLTEALYMSLPVVASAVEGVPELIEHGRTGLLVPPSDPAILASEIVYMLQHPDEARSMGEAARKRVENHFSAERMVEEIDTLYQTVLEEKKECGYR